MGSPEQKAILDRVTGVMSLLEGHADVVMDGVGPSVIPTVDAIRGKFDERRKGVGTLDRLLRRLLGLEAKMAQYRDGAVFVRHVVRGDGGVRFVLCARPRAPAVGRAVMIKAGLRVFLVGGVEIESLGPSTGRIDL